MSGPESWGISAEEAKAITEREALRNVLRREYQRKVNNPTFREFLVDPAVERWNYARHRPAEFFRPSPRSTKWGILFGIVPPVVLIVIANVLRKRKFARWESGEEKKPRNLFNC